MSGRREKTAPPGMLAVGGMRVTVLLRRREVATCAVAACVVVALGFAAIGVGGSTYNYTDAWRVLVGHASPGARLVIVGWRLPRILTAVFVGAALGISGSVFQRITRNPLGSPDLIGFTMGAQMGILVAVVIFGGTLIGVTVAALIGGLGVGAVIFSLALRGGFGGLRLILSGIAVSAMVGSFNRWLIIRADSDTAYAAMRSVTGTLAAADWPTALFVAVAVTGLALGTGLLSYSLRNLPLGQEAAIALGDPISRTQPALVLLATALVAIATTAAGPISFVALVAPHVARIAAGATAPPVVGSALMGSVVLLGSDMASQILLDSMPVGVVTAAFGGFYFACLLLLEARKETP